MKNQALEEATTALAQALAAVIQAVSRVEETQPLPHLYTYDDLAEMFGKSAYTIRQWACAGEFGDLIKVGNSIRIPQSRVDKFISDHSGPNKKRTCATPLYAAHKKINPSGQPLGI